nr:ankyrin repeat domain-containing protein [Rhodoferax sp. U11-2br]
MRVVACAALCVVMAGCAIDPQMLAYRDRLEQGAIGPEDSERFRTSPAETQALVASASDTLVQTASELDRALSKAAASGDVARIRQLIKAGAQVNAVDEWGNTALLMGAREGEMDSARALLRARADVDGRGGVMTPLAAAALRGHTQMVQLLLRFGADVNAVGLNEQTALMNAVKLNRLGAAQALLKAGASTRATDRMGDNLLVVCITEGYPEMLSLLLDNGADPDLADVNGLSPLYWAKLLKRSDMVQRLLAAGASPHRLKQMVRSSQPYTFQEF